MKAIILDIEGTTTDINFVHKVLFPYSAKKFPDFLKNNESNPEVVNVLNKIRQNYLKPDSSLDEILSLIQSWIDEDKKIGELKSLQGMIWKDGFESKEYTSHLYDEVLDCLKDWKERGIDLYIYSSGSVQAQKLLFGHTINGDVTVLFSGYFDTTVGGKKESTSYQNILNEIRLSGNEVLFLSDNEEELDAAKVVGVNTLHVNRDGLYEKSKHKIIENFKEVEL